ncbi:MAG: hypothetical protein COA43_04330 [Robiginitomaculum sp.]|nr:MAG: hypothetical protein COA43_04330 [Robiginitomaculum sp.]
MTVFFEGLSFLWAIAAMGLVASFFGIWAFVGYRKLAGDAAADWDYKLANNMQDLRLTKEAYIRAYRKVNAPRFPLYMAAGAGLILLLTPVVFSLINLGLYGVWIFSDKSRVFEPGYLVWTFSIFFSLIGAWAFIGASVARRFHAKAPGPIRDELINERADFEPTEALVVGDNPAHINASLEGVNRELYKTIFVEILGLNQTIEKNWNGTGHVCDMYSDGTDMKICVHSPKNKTALTAETHPFFFQQTHAREEAQPVEYTIILKLKNTHIAYEKMQGLGIKMGKTTGRATSRLRSFDHENLHIFLYEG